MILNKDGSLDKKRLAQWVLNDKSAPSLLREYLHPLLLKEIKRRIDFWQAQGIKQVILDVPLLLESGWQKYCHVIWLVTASVDKQKARMKARNHYTEKEMEERLHAQWPLAKKIPYADVLIDNNGSLFALRGQVEKLWREVKNK